MLNELTDIQLLKLFGRGSKVLKHDFDQSIQEHAPNIDVIAANTLEWLIRYTATVPDYDILLGTRYAKVATMRSESIRALLTDWGLLGKAFNSFIDCKHYDGGIVPNRHKIMALFYMYATQIYGSDIVMKK